MLAKIFSAAIVGLKARTIEIEAETSYGLPKFTIVGLPDKAVEEARERVSAAIKSIGLRAPGQDPLKVLVSLAPADLKKEGSLYDLPIALAFLTASGQLCFDATKRLFAGELALDGTLRPIKGALSFAQLAREKHFSEIILPEVNAKESAIIGGVKTIGVRSLKEAIDHIIGRKTILPTHVNIEDLISNESYQVDISWIKGQSYAKRALQISAAGNHNMMMQGPPGTGKTLLAQALPSILPPLSFEEALEVTNIYSIAGLLPEDRPLITNRPFRNPHHTASESALIGGGNPPRPGEITLAHRGVLFMDEFPEFHRDVLESLRQPLEEGQITILRSRYRIQLPSRFTLIAASNPCPCGYYRDPERQCSCTPSEVAKYRRKLSGPLMDRFDLFIQVPQIKSEELLAENRDILKTTKEGEEIRTAVAKARMIQQERFKKEGILTNSEMTLSQIEKYCLIDTKSRNFLKKFIDSGKLSARGYHRVLKVARTIADLRESEKISFDDVAEAVAYRSREDL